MEGHGGFHRAALDRPRNAVPFQVRHSWTRRLGGGGGGGSRGDSSSSGPQPSSSSSSYGASAYNINANFVREHPGHSPDFWVTGPTSRGSQSSTIKQKILIAEPGTCGARQKVKLLFVTENILGQKMHWTNVTTTSRSFQNSSAPHPTHPLPILTTLDSLELLACSAARSELLRGGGRGGGGRCL